MLDGAWIGDNVTFNIMVSLFIKTIRVPLYILFLHSFISFLLSLNKAIQIAVLRIVNKISSLAECCAPIRHRCKVYDVVVHEELWQSLEHQSAAQIKVKYLLQTTSPLRTRYIRTPSSPLRHELLLASTDSMRRTV